MVEINNQRKAFLDMLAWSEWTDNGRQKTRNHGYDVIVGGELFTDYSDHLSQILVTLNPNSNQQAPDATSFFPVGGCLPQEAIFRKTSLRKSGRQALQQIKERGALPMIDRGDIRQAIDRCNIWASLPGAGYGQFEHKADSLIAKFKEAGGTVREIDVWAESPRLSPLWLFASSSACHGLLIITVITPLPTKPSATKMPENWSWRTRQLLTAYGCVSVMYALDAKIHEGVSWC